MKFQIKDFCDVHCVEVEPWHNKGDKLVLITQRAGSLSFQHTMRPDQARYMAAALQMAAEQAEKQPEVNHVYNDGKLTGVSFSEPMPDANYKLVATAVPPVEHLPSDDTEGGAA